jgi:hypothetical protein
MRIGFNVLAVASLVAATACTSSEGGSFNPVTPSTTQARLRMINATSNLTAKFHAGPGTATALNSNLAATVSRCFLVNPADPQISILVSTAPTAVGAFADVPVTLPAQTFEAGKSYVLAIHHVNTTPSDVRVTVWDAEGGFTASGDSAGLRVFHAAPSVIGGAMDTYVNRNPASDTLLSNPAVRKIVSAQPIGTLSSYFNVLTGGSYQYRMTRAGITNATIINTSNTLQPGQNATVIIFPSATSLTATTAYRASTTQGC